MESRELGEEQHVSFKFEKLRVWQKAIELTDLVYEVTRSFPREEMFGLTSQVRRAAVSVAANIAEGVSRVSAKDRARFFEVSYGSVNEVVTMFHIASRQKIVEADSVKRVRSEADDLCRMLSGLRSSVLKSAQQ